ncbi:MAG TPA: hypothetical protein VKV80_03465 [Streptosporangiaceae bacterium]|nr:hypothetical protein [Streptosporangiaceae bacterium]
MRVPVERRSAAVIPGQSEDPLTGPGPAVSNLQVQPPQQRRERQAEDMLCLFYCRFGGRDEDGGQRLRQPAASRPQVLS